MLTFAIVEPGEVFDPAIHLREDLTVLSCDLEHSTEGGYARLALEIVNFRVPLPGKRLLFAVDGVLQFDGTITTARGQVGRVVDIEAIAEPSDAEAQKSAAAEALKVAPGYDELTVREEDRGDLAEILAGYSRSLSWGRTSHQLSVVDIYEGSSHIEIEPIEGSLSQSMSKPPSEIRINAVANWRQLKNDLHDVGGALFGLKTMTPEGLIEEWPEPGDTLGTGFIVTEASIEPATDFTGQVKREEVSSEQSLTGGYNIDPSFAAYGFELRRAALTELSPTLRVRHIYELRRKETMSATVPLSLQPGVVYGQAEDLTVNLQELTEPANHPEWEPRTFYLANARVIRQDSIYRAISDHTSGADFESEKWGLVAESSYIASRRYASFFKSARGQAVAEHMLERARARARHVSRCIELTCDCAHPDLALLGENTTATITSPGLIGGSATGKVVEYVVRWGGGRRDARITIACAPGTGIADDMALGAPTIDTPNSSGGVIPVITNPGDFQRRYFEANGDLPTSIKKDAPIIFEGKEIEKTLETIVEFEAVKATSQDLIGTASYPITGAAGVPQGVTI